jgi:protein-L-isoaspartate O-methyltransferase
VRIAPFYPSPPEAAARMLELARLQPGETLFDLGSGDGRLLMLAAAGFGARAVGVEIDANLARLATTRIASAGLQRLARVIHGDLLEADCSAADVVTLYLLPVSADLVATMLRRQLRPGARIVSHDFAFSDWAPTAVESMPRPHAGDERKLYLYEAG